MDSNDAVKKAFCGDPAQLSLSIFKKEQNTEDKKEHQSKPSLELGMVCLQQKAECGESIVKLDSKSPKRETKKSKMAQKKIELLRQ